MTHLESAVPSPQPPALLTNSNFMILWLGQTVSQLGNAFFTFAMVIWIIRTSGAPALAGIMMAAAIPAILLGPVAGTLVDSLDRKKIIVCSDFFQGVVMLLAAWLMHQQLFYLGHIYVLLILFGAIQPLFNSAVSAVMPNMVHGDQLAQANSMRQASVSGTGLIGPALAAILLSILGGVERAIPIFFMLNGISFILSAISEMFLSIPVLERVRAATNGEALRRFGAQLVEGFKYVWQSSMIARLMLILATVSFFTAPLAQVVIPGVIIDTLAMDEMWLGFVQSGIAAGFLSAAILLSIVRQASLSRLVIVGISFMGSAVLLLGLTMALPMYTAVSTAVTASAMIVFALLMGSSAAVVNIALSTIMQKVVPDEKRGRIFAFMNTFISGLIPLSLGAAGLMAALAPLFIQPLIGGVVIMGAGIILKRVKELAQY